MKQELQYLHIPARTPSQGPAPVLLLLHGVGSHEQDIATLAEYFDPRFEIYSLRGPLTLAPQHYAWFHVQFTPQGPIHNQEEAEASRKKVVKFIENLKSNPQIDGDQIFMLGFSQGAIMCLSVGLTEPTLVKGIIPIAGRTLQEISALAQSRIYTQSPKVLLIHGRQDSKLPLFHGQASEEVLRSRHFDLEFKVYEADHEITPAMREDIRNWLETQIKK